MVHTGFSRGCDRCREKHLGCDQTTPACIRCTSQRLSCPGYRDQGGFLFKNESAKVIRNGKQRHTRRTTVGTQTPAVTTTPPVAKTVFPTVSPACEDARMGVPSEPTSTFVRASQDSNINIFLEAFVMVQRDTHISLVHRDTLTRFYHHVESSSPLFPILDQVSWQLSALYQGVQRDSPAHLRCCVAALKAMRTALDDPIQRGQNEALLALMLMDLSERIQDARLLTSASAKHHIAAMALISERDPYSFQDAMSQSLLDALRYGINQRLLWSDLDDLGLEVLDRVEPNRWKPYPVALDHTITQILMLRRQLSRARRNKHSDWPRLLHHLNAVRRDLECQLSEWITTVPVDWHPILQSNPELDTHHRHRNGLEVYINHETAYVYNHWRVSRLLLLGIARRLSTRSAKAGLHMESGDTKSSIIGEAQVLCDSILSSAPYMCGQLTRNDGLETMTLFGPSDMPGQERQELLVDVGMARRLSRWRLFELLQWMLCIVEDAEYGLAVAPDTVVHAKEFLADIWR